ncbi:MAG: 3-oxoacyl-ACP synthase [Thiotrichales bacterium]|nr:MAG: 3-oxoacyl-ACP synthase [Thiotrichales bacterium]
MQAKIASVGHYLPTKILTNHEISTIVDTSDEWIMQRVGIKQRHISSEEETNVFMAERACKMALEKSDIPVDAIDLIIVATSTSDYRMPSTACEVQALLGIEHCVAFDVSAACSGFVYAMDIANKFIKTNSTKNALIIGTERMSRVLDWEDRGTCVLFGDGAAAVLLTATNETDIGILGTKIHSSGAQKDLLFVPNRLSNTPFTEKEEHEKPYLTMQGNKVFRHSVNMLGEVVEEILLQHNCTKDDIDWLIPHQANERIINATAKKFNIPSEKVILTLQNHGNTSAASVPLALSTAIDDGRIKRGDLLLLDAFGAGFVWGSVLVRY